MVLFSASAHWPSFSHLLSLICLLDREKDEDEGIPSETEDDKRQLETKAKEMRGERMAVQSAARAGAGAQTLSASAAQTC